jgi:hypothetical protein
MLGLAKAFCTYFASVSVFQVRKVRVNRVNAEAALSMSMEQQYAAAL